MNRIRRSLTVTFTRRSDQSSRWLLCALLAWFSIGVSLPAPQWFAGVAAVAAQPAEGAAVHAEEEHASIWETVARLTNFAILTGGLFVLLREPLGIYLRNRGDQVREGLAQARVTRVEAARQLESIKEQLRVLPDELEALRMRGQGEMAAEDARLRDSTEVARQRLVEQSQQEFTLELRLAKRDLTQLAAELATRVASKRIHDTMSQADQLRLVDRYVNQMQVD